MSSPEIKPTTKKSWNLGGLVRQAARCVLVETFPTLERTPPKDITEPLVARKILSLSEASLIKPQGVSGNPLTLPDVVQELGYHDLALANLEKRYPDVFQVTKTVIQRLVDRDALKEISFDWNEANRDVSGYIVVNRKLLFEIANEKSS